MQSNVKKKKPEKAIQPWKSVGGEASFIGKTEMPVTEFEYVL